MTQETGQPEIEPLRRSGRTSTSRSPGRASAGETTAGLELLSALELYWATNDPVAGRRAGRPASSPPPATQIAPRVLARALRVRGATYDMTGGTDLSQQQYERAAEIFRSLGDEAEADI